MTTSGPKRRSTLNILDAIFVLVPIAFIVFTLGGGSRLHGLGSAGELERVAYTPPQAPSFFYYVPFLCYCLVLPIYYAFHKRRLLVTMLIVLCLILSLQMMWTGSR
jgi:hypothetical protein